MSLLIKRDTADELMILKSNDDLMIGGYASIEIVDKQNDLITLKALNEAVVKYTKRFDEKFPIKPSHVTGEMSWVNLQNHN